METAGMVIAVFVAVALYFIGYYKGKVDCWNDAYLSGEKAGWSQAMRRQL